MGTKLIRDLRIGNRVTKKILLTGRARGLWHVPIQQSILLLFQKLCEIVLGESPLSGIFISVEKAVHATGLSIQEINIFVESIHVGLRCDQTILGNFFWVLGVNQEVVFNLMNTN